MSDEGGAEPFDCLRLDRFARLEFRDRSPPDARMMGENV
jgi:hypothetical protein